MSTNPVKFHVEIGCRAGGAALLALAEKLRDATIAFERFQLALGTEMGRQLSLYHRRGERALDRSRRNQAGRRGRRHGRPR